MKVVFLSNYFNHHQKPFSDAMYELLKGDYYFISTTVMREERKVLGYGESDTIEYVKDFSAQQELCQKLIDEADVVIFGSAPEHLIKNRLKQNKVVIRYSERPLRNGIELPKYLPRFVRWHRRNPLGKKIYMLCSSAFTPYDYSRFALFRNRFYKWGYFPQTKKYENIEELIDNKDSKKILWVARFLKLKHPDDVLSVAKRLQDEGYDFTLDFIGTGEMEEELKNIINQSNLQDKVSILGPMKPDQVRLNMEKAGIYLFTSDRNEGWGAVLNEAMNSGCAVVSSHVVGATPYLVDNNKNGLVYESSNVEMLYEKTKYLLDHPDEQKRLGLMAYNTIVNEWNAEVAAQRFLTLAERILSGEKHPDLYEDGPCSKANIIKEDWIKYEI